MTISCKKNTIENPASKTDYIPIISANTPNNVTLGQEIRSSVKMGFYSRNADITFLNFEVKNAATNQYEIRAKGFYDNINYEVSLPVTMLFDSTVTIRPEVTGQYLLKFYNSSQLVQIDTVQVN